VTSATGPSAGRSGERLARIGAGPAALFAYGTLQFPEVLQVLLGRVPEHTPGAITGWRAAALPGLVYPGLVPAGRTGSTVSCVSGVSTVSGVLLAGLTSAEWCIIDAYEDDGYGLGRLTLTDGRPGWAYFYDQGAGVLPHDWSAGEFAVRHLAGFAGSCRAWRDGHAAGGQAASGGPAAPDGSHRA
jgi:hypothetical protein